MKWITSNHIFSYEHFTYELFALRDPQPGMYEANSQMAFAC